MTTMTVYYDREPPAVVASVEELDAVFDRIAATPRYMEFPVLVSIEDADRRYTLQIGVGRGDLSVLVWYEAEVDVLASVGTVAYQQRPKFNFGGTPTDAYDDSAVPVEVARRAARHFFAHGTQPTGVTWKEPAYSPSGEAALHPVG